VRGQRVAERAGRYAGERAGSNAHVKAGWHVGRKRDRPAVRQASFCGMDFQENPLNRSREVTVFPK